MGWQSKRPLGTPRRRARAEGSGASPYNRSGVGAWRYQVQPFQNKGPPCQRPQRKQDLGTCGTPHASALDLRARHALHTQPPPLPHIPSHSRRPPLHRTALTAEYAARLPQVPSSQRRRDTPTSSWGECSLHPYFARIPSHLVTQPTHTRRPALHRTAPTAEYAARLPQVPSSLPAQHLPAR